MIKAPFNSHSFLLSLFRFLEKLQGAECRGRGRRVSRSGPPLPGALDSARGTRGPQVPEAELLWHAHPPSPALHSHPENRDPLQLVRKRPLVVLLNLLPRVLKAPSLTRILHTFSHPSQTWSVSLGEPRAHIHLVLSGKPRAEPAAWVSGPDVATRKLWESEKIMWPLGDSVFPPQK